MRYRAGGRRQPKSLGLMIKMTEVGTGLHARGLVDGTNTHTRHRCQINHHAPLTRRFSGNTVAAAAHCDQEIVGARKRDGIPNVRRQNALRD